MAVWEYKVISSGKGGFASPALLESFLNQLGSEEWEIIEFRGQPDNPLAFSGLARRPTQRDWTLGDAAAAAAKVEADRLREEFEAKFRSATAAAAAGAPQGASETEPQQPQGDSREHDGLRSLRDTESDSDPDAPDTDASEDEWDKLGEEDELPTFFEAMRPHLRRNQRGPGYSAGVDYLAKKWNLSEGDVIGALKECGLEIPEDEDAEIHYVEYDGDLYWVNVNRRGELWVNTKEKSRPVFRTVKTAPVEAAEGAKAAEGTKPEEAAAQVDERKHRRQGGAHEPAAAGPLPEGQALLERIRPHMRRNRHEPGGSGSMSFLSRALKCTEAALVDAFTTMGLSAAAAPGEPPVFVQVGDESWWLSKDSRGATWINAREKPADGAPGAQPAPPTGAAADPNAPAPGNVLAAVRLLLKQTRTGGVAATTERLASELGRTVEELLGALTASGLVIPEKAREKPVFVEHAGEIFWLNRNNKGELWLNAKASKYAEDGGGKHRRPRPKKKDEPKEGPVAGVPQEPAPEAPPQAASDAPPQAAPEPPPAA
jgi:hypothetical protein